MTQVYIQTRKSTGPDHVALIGFSSTSDNPRRDFNTYILSFVDLFSTGLLVRWIFPGNVYALLYDLIEDITSFIFKSILN